MTGSGDFSIGSKVWPGTSKLLEEMGELQQVLGKLIAVAGSTEHWDGDLRPRLIEECADVAAALQFFTVENFTREDLLKMLKRSEEKLVLFRQWHTAQFEQAKPQSPLEHDWVQTACEYDDTFYKCRRCGLETHSRRGGPPTTPEKRAEWGSMPACVLLKEETVST